VLNAHGRFFLAYASASFWNVAMIATLLYFGNRANQQELVGWLAWGSVAGCFLQLAAQWPGVMSVLGGFRRQWGQHRAHVATVVRNFVPVFFGRGVSQLSGFIDTMIASLPILGTGAQVTLNYAQLLYGLPVSLFGMAVSAAELPAMASLVGHEQEIAEALREASIGRVRPKLMTAGTAILGLLPLLVLRLHGTEIERPLAVVMVGGLVTSTLFTLLALPSFYLWVVGRTGVHSAQPPA